MIICKKSITSIELKKNIIIDKLYKYIFYIIKFKFKIMASLH